MLLILYKNKSILNNKFQLQFYLDAKKPLMYSLTLSAINTVSLTMLLILYKNKSILNNKIQLQFYLDERNKIMITEL